MSLQTVHSFMVLPQISEFYGGFHCQSPFLPLIEAVLILEDLLFSFPQVLLFPSLSFSVSTSREWSIWTRTVRSAVSGRSNLTYFSPEAAVFGASTIYRSLLQACSQISVFLRVCP